MKKISIKACKYYGYMLKYCYIFSERIPIMRAVITVTGKDKVGIIAMASAECAKYGANIVDISQTVMKEYFAMIMLVELGGLNTDFQSFTEGIRAEGERCGVDIRVMHEDIFEAMHRI